MTLEEFRASVAASSEPPAGLGDALGALWHDAKGHWSRAHEVAQEVASTEGAWVHAYLHRKEGDLGNARYWYQRAGRPEARGSLDDEWAAIVAALLAARSG